MVVVLKNQEEYNNLECFIKKYLKRTESNN